MTTAPFLSSVSLQKVARVIGAEGEMVFELMRWWERETERVQCGGERLEL